MRTPTPIAAALLAVAVAACGGGGSGVTPQAAPSKTTPNNAAGTARGTASIFIPARTTTSSSKRAPRWVSPSTQSITIQITRESDHAGTYYTAVTTPGSTGCTSVTGGTQCQIPFGAPPGTDDVQIYAWDLADPGPAEPLASYTKNGVSFTATADNSMTFTLGGVVANLPLPVPATAFTSGQPSDYTVSFAPTDADSNPITGLLDAPFCVVLVPGAGPATAFTLTAPAAGAAGISTIPCVIPPNGNASNPPTTQAGLGILDASKVPAVVVHYDGTPSATATLYLGTQSMDTEMITGTTWQSVTL